MPQMRYNLLNQEEKKMRDIEKIEALRKVLDKVENTANSLKEHQWVDWNEVLKDIEKIINE